MKPINIESMSHLTSGFPGLVEGEEEGVHPSQQTKIKIKLSLIFVIPGEEDSFRLVSVRVPRGIPIAKLRLLIRYLENQLQDIYGKSKRANFVLVSDDNLVENWRVEFDLPTFGVVYI
jgi:hypothetical protein